MNKRNHDQTIARQELIFDVTRLSAYYDRSDWEAFFLELLPPLQWPPVTSRSVERRVVESKIRDLMLVRYHMDESFGTVAEQLIKGAIEASRTDEDIDIPPDISGDYELEGTFVVPIDATRLADYFVLNEFRLPHYDEYGRPINVSPEKQNSWLDDFLISVKVFLAELRWYL